MGKISVLAPVATAIIAMASLTVVHGMFSERWTDEHESELLTTMAARIPNTPLQFGEWEGTVQETTEDLETQYERAHVHGHIDVTYRNVRTQQQVQISLVIGTRRHIGVHTPDKCYLGAGFNPKSAPQQKSIAMSDGSTAEVKAQEFYRKSPVGDVEGQHIVWCWSSNGEWVAPDLGRFDRIYLAAKSPVWFKLYVTKTENRVEATNDVEQHKAFMRDFLPELNRVLFTETADNAEASSEAAAE